MRALSMTPRDAGVGTPRLSLTSGISSAAVAALTPRFFAAREQASCAAPAHSKADILHGYCDGWLYLTVVSRPHLSLLQGVHVAADFMLPGAACLPLRA